jgi:hypothetical protein
MLSATILIHKNMMNSTFAHLNLAVDSLGLTSSLSLQALSLIKTAYLYFMSCAILKTVSIRKSSSHFLKVSGRASRALKFLLLATLILSFILIGVCNPSMLNPGMLKVCYQNIQGVIPFSQLGDAHCTPKV